MASSSSSVGNRMNRSRRQGLRSRCWCGDLVGKWTAWTPGNPGRRFVGCPNFQDEHKDRGMKTSDLADVGLDMMFFSSCPSKEEWNGIMNATKNGFVLTGSAIMGQIWSTVGNIDIGEWEFSSEVEDDGKVLVRGVEVSEGNKAFRIVIGREKRLQHQGYIYEL
ncbi:hypothetical protein LXL04_014192 [Taraxacum kok-saghyz]